MSNKYLKVEELLEQCSIQKKFFFFLTLFISKAMLKT